MKATLLCQPQLLFLEAFFCLKRYIPYHKIKNSFYLPMKSSILSIRLIHYNSINRTVSNIRRLILPSSSSNYSPTYLELKERVPHYCPLVLRASLRNNLKAYRISNGCCCLRTPLQAEF